MESAGQALSKSTSNRRTHRSAGNLPLFKNSLRRNWLVKSYRMKRNRNKKIVDKGQKRGRAAAQVRYAPAARGHFPDKRKTAAKQKGNNRSNRTSNINSIEFWRQIQSYCNSCCRKSGRHVREFQSSLTSLTSKYRPDPWPNFRAHRFIAGLTSSGRTVAARDIFCARQDAGRKSFQVFLVKPTLRLHRAAG